MLDEALLLLSILLIEWLEPVGFSSSESPSLDYIHLNFSNCCQLGFLHSWIILHNIISRLRPRHLHPLFIDSSPYCFIIFQINLGSNSSCVYWLIWRWWLRLLIPILFLLFFILPILLSYLRKRYRGDTSRLHSHVISRWIINSWCILLGYNALT